MKPIKVIITPCYLILRNVPDEVAENLQNCDVDNYAYGYNVMGKKEDLYNVLLELSKNYDLELI